MGTFSSLIDISSFFVGVLINLLLIAMICYYFKRKIDNLEVSQAEQAKMLYGIISQQQQIEGQRFNDSLTSGSRQVPSSGPSVSVLGGLDLAQLENTVEETTEPRIVDMTEANVSDVDHEEDVSVSDSEGDEGESSDEESVGESESEENHDDVVVNVLHENNQEEDESVSGTKSITYDVSADVDKVYEYDKMTVRELKQILGNKGVHNIKSNTKKQELIDILVREDNKEPEPTFMKSDESHTEMVDEIEEGESSESDVAQDTNEVVAEDIIDVEDNTELIE